MIKNNNENEKKMKSKFFKIKLDENLTCPKQLRIVKYEMQNLLCETYLEYIYFSYIHSIIPKSRKCFMC